jgi:hypothetical protein
MEEANNDGLQRHRIIASCGGGGTAVVAKGDGYWWGGGKKNDGGHWIWTEVTATALYCCQLARGKHSTAGCLL